MPDVVRKSRADALSQLDLFKNRQLLFGEVRRSVHKVVKHVVCNSDVEDACHSLTDYILLNPTDDVLDFITAPLVAFEVLQAAWRIYQV